MKAAILNVSGYAGAELARILHRHPDVAIAAVTGRSAAGKRLGEVFPHLFDVDLTIVPEVKLGSLASVKFSDVQLARPVAVVHKKSKALSPALENFLTILTGE